MNLLIIGGGPAGLMAAVAARETNETAHIVLLERNDAVGKKLLLTGGGRCNVTTGIDDVREVLARYPRGGKFLSSAMHRFPPAETRKFFETHGIPLKTEADQRVFPVSENGHDVVAVFGRILSDVGVTVHCGATVERIKKAGRGFSVYLRGAKKPLTADRVIVTTGGQAYRQTGSTGDGYAFAQSLGHSITDLHPSLTSLKTSEKWPAELAGVSFERVKLTAANDKKMSQMGPLMFTHQGITGPAVFALSALIAERTIDARHPLEIAIDLFPDDMPADTLVRLMAEIDHNRRRSIKNVLAEFVPRSVADITLRELRLKPETHAAEMGKKDVRLLADWLNGIPLHVIGRSAGEEFVTAGGISLEEVNPSTMESKICPGLFFAGEILNVDGFTGGFNLQAAWATGRLAGTSAGG